jgi:hypothetical protein
MAGTRLDECLVRSPLTMIASPSSKLPIFTLFLQMDPPSPYQTGIADSELGMPIDKAAATPTPCIAKLDPFGDESDAGLKYKSMTWW